MTNEGLHLVHQLNDGQISDLHVLYQNEWWTHGRSLDDVKRMLRHTDYVFGVCRAADNQLVAFARVLTDRVFKALIFDVIVSPAYRGQRLGSELMKSVVEHPDLASVAHIELYCLPELVPFYEREGFSADVAGVQLMRRHS